MKRFTCVLLLLFTSTITNLQAQTWQWLKDIETTSTSVVNNIKSASDANGNTYVAGNYGELMMGGSLFVENTTLTSSGSTENFIVKYNESGTVVWTKSFGNTRPDYFGDIVCDALGNVYVTGTFSSSLTIDGTTLNSNQTDLFLIKLNSAGILQWAQQSNVGLTLMGSINSLHLATDANNNCIVNGEYNGTCVFGSGSNTNTLTSLGALDIFICKYNTSGILQWAKSVGSVESDFANGVKADASGNVVFTGLFGSSTNNTININGNTFTSAGGTDLFLAMYNSNGNYVWANVAGGTGNDLAQKLSIDKNSNIYVTGMFGGNTPNTATFGNITLNSAGSRDVFLAKYNSTGNVLWAKAGGGTTQDLAYDVVNNSTNDFIYLAVQGSTSANYGGLAIGTGTKIVKYNSEGIALDFISAGTYGINFQLSTWNNSLYCYGFYIFSLTLGSNTVNTDPTNSNRALYLARYNDVPPTPASITSFAPEQGVVGSSVIIKGVKLTGATAIRFNNVNANNFNVVNDSTIIATVPANASTGKISITVPSASLTSTNDFVVRTISNTSYAWQWAVQSTNTSSLKTIADAAVDNNGSVITVGSYKNSYTFGTSTITSTGGYDMFILKNDANGNLVWLKGIGSSAGDDEAQGVSTDAFGNIYVAGYFNGSISIGNTTLTSTGDADVFILKFTADGSLIWANQAGGTNRDQGFDIKVDALGNSYLTGRFYGTANFGGISLNTNSSYAKTFTAMYDANGNALWAKEATSTADNYGNSVTFDASGNCYVMGYFSLAMTFSGVTITPRINNIDYFLVKYNASGNLEWAKRIDGDFIANLKYMTHIVSDAAGNIFIAGSENVSNTKTSMIAKYSSDGNLIWKKTGLSNFQNFAYDIALNRNGEISIIGNAVTILTFDNVTINKSGMYIARFDAQGAIIAAYQSTNTTPSSENGFAVCTDDYNNIYCAGFFSGTPSFGPSSLSTNTSDVFIAKITSNALNVNNNKQSPLIVYPNPVIGSTLFISNADDAPYEIINSMGQVVQRGTIENSSIDVSALPSGLYILKTEKGNARIEL